MSFFTSLEPRVLLAAAEFALQLPPPTHADYGLTEPVVKAGGKAAQELFDSGGGPL